MGFILKIQSDGSQVGSWVGRETLRWAVRCLTCVSHAHQPMQYMHIVEPNIESMVFEQVIGSIQDVPSVAPVEHCHSCEWCEW